MKKGRVHDEYSDILRGIFRENRSTIVPPHLSASGEELLPANPPKNLHVVFALALKQSTLHPGSTSSRSIDSSPGRPTISGKLRRPTGVEAILKDATTDVTLYRSDVLCKTQGMTKAGKQRIFHEAMLPIAEQVVGLIRKQQTSVSWVE